MGSEWKKVKLKEIARFKNGKKIAKFERNKNGKNYIYGSNGVIGKTDKVLVKDSCIIIGRVGAYCGSLQYSKGFSWITDNAIFCLTNKNADLKFLFYVLRTIPIREMAGGSAQPLINQTILKNITISCPPLPEQQKIASILSAFDDKIELNNEMNKTLEKIAQTVFKHWFIDFEFPNENGEPYKSSGGEFEDSELGPIPKGWKVKSLDEIADFLNGLAMQKYRPKNEKEYLPVLKIKELRQGETSQNSDKCTNKIKQRYIVNDGDIIFSWSGSLLVKIWCGGKAGLNQHLFKVTSNSYPKWFYYRWIKHYLDNFRRIAEDKATTMGHIKREHLKHAKVIVPNEEELNVFDKVFDSLIEKYISNKQQIKTLSQLRDTLLPKLISGEIRVV